MLISYLSSYVFSSDLISWDCNGYECEVSAGSAWIIATLFTLSDLAITHQDPLLGDAFHRLYEFARGHPEAAEIGSAIDSPALPAPRGRDRAPAPRPRVAAETRFLHDGQIGRATCRATGCQTV